MCDFGKLDGIASISRHEWMDVPKLVDAGEVLVSVQHPKEQRGARALCTDNEERLIHRLLAGRVEQQTNASPVAGGLA